MGTKLIKYCHAVVRHPHNIMKPHAWINDLQSRAQHYRVSSQIAQQGTRDKAPLNMHGPCSMIPLAQALVP